MKSCPGPISNVKGKIRSTRYRKNEFIDRTQTAYLHKRAHNISQFSTNVYIQQVASRQACARGFNCRILFRLKS